MLAGSAGLVCKPMRRIEIDMEDNNSYRERVEDMGTKGREPRRNS
jgi:hypothetical protein